MTSTDLSPFATSLPDRRAAALASRTDDDRFTRLEKWSGVFMQCAEVAKVLANTPYVPKEMQGKPEVVAASMLKGLELGIDPLDALDSLYVVHGRVGFYAVFMRRRLIEAGHDFEVVEATDSRAIVRARRRGSEEWRQQTFTADQAKKAGINLGNYPADKLVARATARMVRYNFPDVLAGSAIVEDLEDQFEVEAPPVQATAQRTPARKTARRSSARAVSAAKAKDETPAPDQGAGQGVSEGMPPLPGDEDAPVAVGSGTGEEVPAPVTGAGASESKPDVSGGVEMCTRSQQQKLAILLKEEGFDERADKLKYLEQNFGRPFGSSAELTKVEASQFIDFLENAQAGEQG